MRSKVLLISNIIASVYSSWLLWYFGGTIVAAGGMDYIYYFQTYFKAAFDMLGYSSVSVNVLYAIVILLLIHICTITLGVLFGWIGFISKKSGIAKFAATFYLLATICFPIYILFGLPITILGFVGGGKQKKINKSTID